tara:strand:- start:2352 stop:4451 length:2100 start_codon:yes stop_codon:yes gene_type:complete
MKYFFVFISLVFACNLQAQKEPSNATEAKPIKEEVSSISKGSVSINDVTIEMLNSLREKSDKEASTKKSNDSKLIERANIFFNKMWYAEAAELYELALKDKSNYSFENLSKVADSYYFISNMKKAYEWYDILYTNYKDEMTSDNYFKYAHTLKGASKYAKAKRLMRLYNKIENNESFDIDTNKDTNSEVVLDNIIAEDDKFIVRNLSINSEYSDFSPMFYENNKIVYSSAKDTSVFRTKKYKWTNQPFLDLYVSKINDESSDLKGSIKFSKQINSKYHEASVTFSPDNKTMYFTRNNYGKKLKRDKNGINNLKIYTSKKIGDQWTEATELPFNSDAYSTGHPALSSDGKLLYFVSDMPGSIGETDIFVVDVLENDAFSSPRNLGPEINTDKKEMFPFLTDNKLYFSSNGHVGLGGLDVYEATNTEEGFKEVKNIGKPVNSNKDDFSYIVKENTQKGYFASNRAGGKGDDDIYSFERIPIEEINASAISGIVTELITGNFMPKALVMLLDENNIKLKEIETADDGSFIFEDLSEDKKYTIRTTKEEYIDDIQNVKTTTDETASIDVTLKKLEGLIIIEDGIKKLKRNKIYFDFDKFNIRKDEAQELDKLVEVMNEYPEMVIKIESHTDSRGTKAYNRYLSDKRAKSSRDYIISKGINANRIESAIGYGEDKLLNECDGSVRCTKEQYELNRRSEFIIVKM